MSIKFIYIYGCSITVVLNNVGKIGTRSFCSKKKEKKAKMLLLQCWLLGGLRQLKLTLTHFVTFLSGLLSLIFLWGKFRRKKLAPILEKLAFKAQPRYTCYF